LDILSEFKGFLPLPKLQRTGFHMFFKEIVEMSHFGEAQCIGNFSYIPFAVFEEDFGFLNQPFCNDLGSGFSCIFFDGTVEVVDMYIEMLGIIRCRAQFDLGMIVFNWKLPLQQFHKHGRNSLRGIERLPMIL
jgi:hypothetical protein